ncbi:hypothetical protein NC99_38250 [Sunxiuqinia dokdonensis]|uniref:Uncharacterized protein n=2 Tax=Sunxiuqinia dokdonensis TaxID=1409788 RepID=A0A0L8V4V8_9BACT|nr:hypothetical protein NC99_38250 [Sunxiuqinia dokdonensis]
MVRSCNGVSLHPNQTSKSKMKQTLIQITHNGMGTGDGELGLLLVQNYLKLLSEERELPQVMAFYNGGVKLICSGSPVVGTLQTLEQKGVKLMACKTCLNHFGLINQMEVGIAGTMTDILLLQKAAEKVINL